MLKDWASGSACIQTILATQDLCRASGARQIPAAATVVAGEVNALAEQTVSQVVSIQAATNAALSTEVQDFLAAFRDHGGATGDP